MVLLVALLLLCLPALHSHLRLPLAHALEQKHLSSDKAVEFKDLKGAGAAQLDTSTADPLGALPEAVPTSLHTDVGDSTADTWEEIHGPTLPLTIPTPTPGSSRDPSQGQVSSSEEEDEGEDQTCDKAWKKSHRLAKGLMKFSFDLLREVQLESSGENVILSPFSITLALSHLALGAAGGTERRVLEALRVAAVPCVHRALSGARASLPGSLLGAAARLYLRKGLEVKEKFLEDSEKFYGAKPVTLSGNSEHDLVAINKWVEGATHGQIPTFLRQLPADTVMLLLSAIHFHAMIPSRFTYAKNTSRQQSQNVAGFWRNKFDANLTGPDIFHLDNNFMVPVEMMKAQKYSLSWFTLESLDIQVAKFPFKGNMSFLAIAPNQFTWNVSHVLENFPYERLRSLFPKEVPTTVKIPKLKVDYHLELNKVLSQMGLQELFTNPDLQKITEEPLFVSSIQHQSALELKEDGVEASAATSIMLSRSLSAFSLDRPFLFIIFDEETGIPLFIGSIQNPNPSAAPQMKVPQDSHNATDVTEYPMPK